MFDKKCTAVEGIFTIQARINITEMGGKLVLLERFHTISFVVTTFTRDKLYIPVSLRYVSGEGRFDFIFSAASKTGVVVVGIVLFDVGHKVGDILCLIRTAVTDVEHLGVLLLLLLLLPLLLL